MSKALALLIFLAASSISSANQDELQRSGMQSRNQADSEALVEKKSGCISNFNTTGSTALTTLQLLKPEGNHGNVPIGELRLALSEIAYRAKNQKGYRVNDHDLKLIEGIAYENLSPTSPEVLASRMDLEGLVQSTQIHSRLVQEEIGGHLDGSSTRSALEIIERDVPAVGLRQRAKQFFRWLFRRPEPIQFSYATSFARQLSLVEASKRLSVLAKSLNDIPPLTHDEAFRIVRAFGTKQQKSAYKHLSSKIFTIIDQYNIDSIEKELQGLSDQVVRIVLKNEVLAVDAVQFQRLLQSGTSSAFSLVSRGVELKAQFSIDAELSRLIDEKRPVSTDEFRLILILVKDVDLFEAVGDRLKSAELIQDVESCNAIVKREKVYQQVSHVLTLAEESQTTDAQDKILWNFVKKNAEVLTTAELIELAEATGYADTQDKILLHYASLKEIRSTLTVDECIQLAEATQYGDTQDKILKGYAKHNIDRLNSDDLNRLGSATHYADSDDKIRQMNINRDE